MDKQKVLTKSIFVAYAYNIYDRRDYRNVYAQLEKSYGVKFIFADEKITNMHILQKIISYIRSSDISVFDISGWNPNVTLELGIALAMSDNWYIAYNPDKTELEDVPSDIKGIDRLQYRSFAELSEKLAALLEQRYPRVEPRQPLDDYVDSLKDDILKLIKKQPGLRMEEIADITRVNVKMAQMIVTPLVGSVLRYEGQKRGARYYLNK
jgi:hypothetical protein